MLCANFLLIVSVVLYAALSAACLNCMFPHLRFNFFNFGALQLFLHNSHRELQCLCPHSGSNSRPSSIDSVSVKLTHSGTSPF